MSSGLPVLTKTESGPHMVMAPAILMRASSLVIAASLRWLASSRLLSSTLRASSMVRMPLTSARMSTPFFNSSMPHSLAGKMNPAWQDERHGALWRRRGDRITIWLI